MLACFTRVVSTFLTPKTVNDLEKNISLPLSLSPPPPTAAGKRGAICLHQRTDRGRRRSSSEVNGGAPLTRRRSIFNLFHAKLPSITGLSRRAARLALRWRRSCVVVGGGPDSRIPPATVTAKLLNSFLKKTPFAHLTPRHFQSAQLQFQTPLKLQMCIRRNKNQTPKSWINQCD